MVRARQDGGRCRGRRGALDCHGGAGHWGRV